MESPAALEEAGFDHGLAVRHVRDVIRHHVVQFVAENHRPKTRK
jgi:hypothetical protein